MFSLLITVTLYEWNYVRELLDDRGEGANILVKASQTVGEEELYFAFGKVKMSPGK